MRDLQCSKLPLQSYLVIFRDHQRIMVALNNLIVNCGKNAKIEIFIPRRTVGLRRRSLYNHPDFLTSYISVFKNGRTMIFTVCVDWTLMKDSVKKNSKKIMSLQ